MKKQHPNKMGLKRLEAILSKEILRVKYRYAQNGETKGAGEKASLLRVNLQTFLYIIG